MFTTTKKCGNIVDDPIDAPGLPSRSRHKGHVAVGRPVHGDRGAAKAVGDVNWGWPAAGHNGGGSGGGARVDGRSPPRLPHERNQVQNPSKLIARDQATCEHA